VIINNLYQYPLNNLYPNGYKTYDLAVRMIPLSGLLSHEEIKIAETGLRPEPKSYKGLWVIEKETLPTSNIKIIIREIRPNHYKLYENQINDLLSGLSRIEVWKLAAQMMITVPEFISKNSYYESLDTVSSKEVMPNAIINVTEPSFLHFLCIT